MPESLRIGEPDEYGQFRWSIRKTDFSRWLSDLHHKLPKKFPPSYYSLVSRYTFPAFQLGSIFLLGNTGENIYWELRYKIFKNEFMARTLFENRYLQIGHPDECNYGPICFDMKKGEECPIVQIDHEGILCKLKTNVTREIAKSFPVFLQDTVG